MSDQVLIHINVKHAMGMGIRFFFASKPAPTFYTSRASLRSDSDPPSGPGFHIGPPPSPIERPPGTPYHRNKLTSIITPGNEFGFLPLECLGKVELVRIRRKVLFSVDKGVKQKPIYKKNLDSDIESAEDATKDMNEHVEVTEKEMDQFYVDLPIDRKSHSELKEEALAILSV